MIKTIDVGFSIHRPEMVPLIQEAMGPHGAIFLEEPSLPGFIPMLEGAMEVDAYLLGMDAEYPEFSRQIYCVARKFHEQGKEICQVEPFFDALLEIHDFFGSGHTPEEIDPQSVQFQVYKAERHATRALLAYYKIVMAGTFDPVIVAIKQFARADAARFRLRDSLRAQALIPMIRDHDSVFVEAGAMHYFLWQLLWRKFHRTTRVNPLFMTDKHLFGPGDLLTLFYIFNPGKANRRWEDLMCARAIIYSKILHKEEMHGDDIPFPHITNERACIAISKKLSYEACRHLFDQIRFKATNASQKIVNSYIRKNYS